MVELVKVCKNRKIMISCKVFNIVLIRNKIPKTVN
jgi:hypothetical protein